MVDDIPYTDGLHHLGQGTYAYLQPPGTWGFSNCGLVVDDDDALLVDTQFDLPLTEKLLTTIRTALPRVNVRSVVTTHANGDHCWGNQLLPDAEVIGSETCAHGMADEVQPAEIAALSASEPAVDGPLGDYMRRSFGRFDFGGITVTPPTRTFTGRLDVTVGGRVVQLIEVGPAHTDGDVVVHVPDAGVVFAGDILFCGDHPIMWTGPIGNWIRACQLIEHTGARYVVPGHGPVTDVAGVAVFRGYLEYLAEQARARHDRGMAYWEAAADLVLPEPYAPWGHRERLVITVATLYREFGAGEPTPLMEVLHHTAVADQQLRAQR